MFALGCKLQLLSLALSSTTDSRKRPGASIVERFEMTGEQEAFPHPMR